MYSDSSTIHRDHLFGLLYKFEVMHPHLPSLQMINPWSIFWHGPLPGVGLVAWWCPTLDTLMLTSESSFGLPVCLVSPLLLWRHKVFKIKTLILSCVHCSSLGLWQSLTLCQPHTAYGALTPLCFKLAMLPFLLSSWCRTLCNSPEGVANENQSTCFWLPIQKCALSVVFNP